MSIRNDQDEFRRLQAAAEADLHLWNSATGDFSLHSDDTRDLWGSPASDAVYDVHILPHLQRAHVFHHRFRAAVEDAEPILGELRAAEEAETACQAWLEKAAAEAAQVESNIYAVEQLARQALHQARTAADDASAAESMVAGL